MRAQWPRKAALLALLAALFLLTATPTAADKPPPPEPIPPIVDGDRDKLFDDLEQSLAAAPAGQPFDVIVLLQQPLTTANLDALRQRVGPFDTAFQYPSINGFAATLSKGQIIALARLELVKQIEPDRLVRPTLDNATLWFGVQAARTDFGVDGNADGSAATYSSADIVIAVLDTGVNAAHVDLDGGKVIAFKDFINNQTSPYDEGASGPANCSFHGTHVSSIAAGEGQGNSAFKGVAPGAALVGVKVLGIQTLPGAGKACVGTTSQVNGGLQWVIDNKSAFNIRVFNMSLGVGGCFDGTDSQSQLVNAAVAAGLIAVVSAGNEGPAACTIGSPAAAQDAITVAAMSDVNPGPAVRFGCDSSSNFVAGGFRLVCFSSRGPTADGRIKPDIAAPGVLINAADGATTSGYKNLSGTSMSSPFTAGAAALMLDANPALTPAQVKSTIMSTAVDWGTFGKDIDYGAGRLDAHAAVDAVTAASGTNIIVPNHQLVWGELAAAGQPGDTDNYTITVTDATKPLAVTLIMPTWTTALDFDVILLDQNGLEVARSESARRQETIGLASPVNGPYTLRVFAFTGGGFTSIGGSYFFDISVGGNVVEPVSISLTSDGTTPFGVRGFNVTVDTTAGGTNDVQTVQVTTGPAKLYIKTTRFGNDGKVWSLGTSAGADRVVWQFSTDGTGWTTFTQPDALILLASSVSAGGTRDVYLRLTTPTSTSGSGEYRAVVTVVAVAP